MSDFWWYFNIGLQHVLDINGYDHVLFLMALSVPYTFKHWRTLLVMLTLFTVGHTMSLILAVYGVISIRAEIIEFLIPVTILAAALYNFFRTRKGKKAENVNIAAFGTLFFGIIHGLGFSNYFKIVLSSNSDDKLLPLLEFALGIEAAQIVVVLAVLLLSFIVQNFLRVSQRDWVLVTSSLIAGIIIPMLINSEIWQ